MVEPGKLSCDYLVVGCGAAAIAFVDALLTEWKLPQPPSIIMVDRRANPGGHWCDSYSFVRLHQPAALYGVNSKVLGDARDRLEVDNLSSGVELQAYYREVLQSLEAKGVKFLAKYEYELGRNDGAHVVTSLLDPAKQYKVEVAKKLVDGAYIGVTIPSTHPPKYAFDKEKTTVVPVNSLVNLSRSYEVYTVVGAGKTGIDACLWLIDNDVDPDRIHWVMPNDSWMFIRAGFTEGTIIRNFGQSLSAFDEAESLEHLFHLLEDGGQLTRLDKTREPTMWRCATVSDDEMVKLRSIKNIIRKGRIKEITPQGIVFQEGTVPIEQDTIFVDCTSDGLAKREAVPIFQDRRIVLQPIFQCQSVYSASYIAFMETRSDLCDIERNRQCLIIPHPTKPSDYLQAIYYMFKSERARDYESFRFNSRSRLSANFHMFRLQNTFSLLGTSISAIPYLFKSEEFANKVQPGGALGNFERIAANEKAMEDYDKFVAERQKADGGWFFSRL